MCIVVEHKIIAEQSHEGEAACQQHHKVRNKQRGNLKEHPQDMGIEEHVAVQRNPSVNKMTKETSICRYKLDTSHSATISSAMGVLDTRDQKRCSNPRAIQEHMSIQPHLS